MRDKPAFRVIILAAFAALLISSGLHFNSLTAAPGPGDRTISFYHIHTKETLTITYKSRGQYIPEAMKKIDWIMRDWRLNESITMDPETIDLLWEMHTELGSKEPIHIICGYRSRGTNNMLRRTRGGQASNSQHITGKAIDAMFPDVPLKLLRYSAVIRERGGVGYYPTSGIPFVHVDTSRVRAWPRLPRYELALLFPNGRTQHRPLSGGPISKADADVARSRYKDVAAQIAQFDTLRGMKRPAGGMIAVASNDAPPVPVAKPKPATGPVLAALTPEPKPASVPKPKPVVAAKAIPDNDPAALGWKASPRGVDRPQPQQVAALPPPKLLSAPRLIERPSRFSKAPDNADRSKLTALVKQTLDEPLPRLIAAPAPAVRPPPKDIPAAVAAAPPIPDNAPKVAALDPASTGSEVMSDAQPEDWNLGWVKAPEYDEDHPEDLAYAPFPLKPLLTDTSSVDDPALARMQHHDVARTLELIDDDGAVLPMRLRPGQQVAETMWAQQFQGQVVDFSAFSEPEPPTTAASGLHNKSVKTLVR